MPEKLQPNEKAVPLGNLKQVKKLMVALGSPKAQHNPLPPTQHAWMLDEDIPPTIYRMWGWMVDHILNWDCARYTEDFGRRSPHATNKKGKVLFLDHMSADLGIEIHNLAKYWEWGVKRGIWRNGTAEHEHKKGLYLCGEVPQATEIRTQESASGVCTYPWEKLPPYLVNEIRKLPAEKLEKFTREFEVREKVAEQLKADVTAAARFIIDQDDDTWFSEFGLEKKRNGEHKANGVTPEERQARTERLKALEPALLGYVHTLKDSVQTKFESSYKVPESAVQTAATLLPSELSELSERASEPSLEVPARPLVSSPSHQGQRLGYLPAVESIERWIEEPGSRPLPHLSAEVAEMILKNYPEPAETFFWNLSAVQEWKDDPAFTEFSPERKVDQIFVARLVVITGARRDPARAIQFVMDVVAKFKGLGPDRFGKRPPRSPVDPGGPRTFGLLLHWAKDFRRANPLPEREGAAHA